MKLNYKQTVLIGFAFMSILAFWQFYDQVIPYILENRFGLNTFITNAVMSIDNVLALFMLPLFGMLSDRTNTRLGKRTPYILFGTIAAAVLMFVLSLFERKLMFTGFMITLIALLVVMSTYRSPAVAYMPDVTEKPLRSKANAVINLIGYIGGIFATIVMMFLLKSEKTADGTSVYSSNQSFTTVFVIIADFMLISVLIMTFFVNENAISHVAGESVGEESKNNEYKLTRGEKTSFALILVSVFLWFCAYNAVTTAFSRYCQKIWGVSVGKSSGYLLLGTLAAIVAFLPLGFLSSRLGRKKTVLIGIAIMTVCFAVAGFIRRETPLMYIIFAFVGIGWAAINVNSYPMAVEIGSGGNIGKYTGLYYTFSMAAQIATPLLSGLIITRTDWGYATLFPYAVVFSAGSLITMSLVRHGDCKPEIKTAVMENLSGMED
ncbi:MAG: MFS transporter [Clostridia bacterium]|nr:MFS transporter [Clostridia bacterium]